MAKKKPSVDWGSSGGGSSGDAGWGPTDWNIAPQHHVGWLGEIENAARWVVDQAALSPMINPAASILRLGGSHLPKPIRVPLQIEAGLGYAPFAAAEHPLKTSEQGIMSLAGLPSMGFATGGLIHNKGFSKAFHILATGIANDYKKRYGPNWRQEAAKNPFADLSDMLIVMGPAFRSAAALGALRSLRLAGEPATLSKLWGEIAAPGSRGGLIRDPVSGELMPPPTTHKVTYTTPEGTQLTKEFPISRSPFRRAMQEAGIDLSEELPGLPGYGALARVSRGATRDIARAVDRTLGQVLDPTVLKKLGKAGRTRLYWVSQLGVHSDEGLKAWRDILHSLYHDDTPTGNADADAFIFHAKQLGFGDKLLQRLDDAIAYKPDANFEKAWQSLRDATNVSENTIADANGFTSLATDLTRATDHLKMLHAEGASADAITTATETVAGLKKALVEKEPALRSMFEGRRNRMRETYLANLRSNAPEAQAWHDWLSQHPNIGPEQADEAIWIADRFAHRFMPDNPAEYWRTRIGSPQGETAQQFMTRVGSNALFQNPSNFRRFAVEDTLGAHMNNATVSGDNPYYSQLQRWAVKTWDAPKRAVDLEDELKAAIKEPEYYNAGFDQWLRSMPPDHLITQDEFLQHLSNPLNAYDIIETYRVNLDHLPREAQTIWDKPNKGGLLSRTPAPGEYREITMTLPGGPGQRGTFGLEVPMKYLMDPISESVTNQGAAWMHWHMPDVVFHIRLHVFEENGVKKLLVEEIQSDWESSWRKQALAHLNAEIAVSGRKLGRTEAEDAMALAKSQFRDLPMDVKQQLKHLFEQADLIENEIDYARDDLISARLHGPSDDVNQLELELGRLEIDHQDVLDEIERLGVVPPSPLGKSYYEAAIRRVGREAAEEQAHEVHFTDPRVQHIRNHNYSNEIPHLKKEEEATSSNEQMGAWLERIGQLDRQDTRYKKFLGGFGNWNSLYAEKYPTAFRKEYGVGKAEAVPNGYQGRYSDAYGYKTVEGDLPSIRVEMTPAAWEKAKLPQPLYQRQPEWGALPHGATELLANGDRVIHMFRTANISTWIHELAHTAVFDLEGADRKTLEDFFGGGKSIEEWKDSQHENFARAFEQYLRDGNAPNEALKKPFAAIARWMRAVYKEITDQKIELPQEVHDVFDRMLFHDENVPDVFIPHRANEANLSGLRTSRMMPRANREIGTEVKSRIPMFKRNRLVLLRSGMLDDDPAHLFEHASRSLALAKANNLREAVLELAVPLRKGDPPPDFKTQYVVKRAGNGVDKALYDALENADNPDEIRQVIKTYIDDAIVSNENDLTKAKLAEGWTGEDQLYVVNKKAVDQLFKYATGKKPGATTAPKTLAGKIADSVLDSTRALLLYANPGFYVANMAGNGFMMSTSDPIAWRYFPDSFKNALKAASGSSDVSPLWHQITVEMGRGPTAGQLSSGPSYLGAALQSKGRTLSEFPTQMSRAWGGRSGHVIDDSFRVAAWKRVAAKHGFASDARQSKLLEAAAGHSADMRGLSKQKRLAVQRQAEKELASIRDEAENLMLDFDSMTPFERNWLTRAIFLYPFLRASVKYPFMFAGERPTVAGALGQAGLIGNMAANQAWGPRDPNLPLWAQGYSRIGPNTFTNFGSVSPLQPLLGIAESALSVGGPAPVGINRPISYLNPIPQLLIEMARTQNKYGRDTNWGQILKQDYPLPAWLAQLAHARQPSPEYTNRDFWDTLLRSTRLYPFGMGQQNQPGWPSVDWGSSGGGSGG